LALAQFFFCLRWPRPFLCQRRRQLPRPPPLRSASAGTNPPKSTVPPENPVEKALHPDINYSVWLYVAPASVIFGLLIYNEWNQRRQKARTAAAADEKTGQP
jgi:hypothetical protein